jgi:hypothetical protein
MTMKKILPLLFLVVFLYPLLSTAQEKDTLAPTQGNAQIKETKKSEPAAASNLTKTVFNPLRSGFYLKLGPSFPVGNYAAGQTIYDTASPAPKGAIYYPAKIGGAMDIGFLIYFGPPVANNHLRFGLDATFVAFNFNSITVDTIATPRTKYWYYYLGQKFGPVISVCPVDKLVIDFSYKLNAYVAYLHHIVRGKYNDEWGKNLFQSEVSMNIRYSVMLISFQYNFGQCTYDDFDKLKPQHKVDNSTFRFLVGFKF